MNSVPCVPEIKSGWILFDQNLCQLLMNPNLHVPLRERQKKNLHLLSKENDDPMDRLVDDVFEQIQPQYEEEVLALINRETISEEARDRTYQRMKAAYRRALANVFTDSVMWISVDVELKASSIFQSIKKTVDRAMQSDDFDREEAWKYAENKRKFLFEALMYGLYRDT